MLQEAARVLFLHASNRLPTVRIDDTTLTLMRAESGRFAWLHQMLVPALMHSLPWSLPQQAAEQVRTQLLPRRLPV
jgi:hypothetical protein